MFRISSTTLKPTTLRRKLLDPRAGGYVSFEGRVRNRNAGRKVRRLEYETYRELAEKEGTRIIAEARRKFAIISAACVHRCGRLQVGDIAVWAGATAEHRGAAFAACSYIIDETKKRVPIWKKEHYATGRAKWISRPTGGNAAKPGAKRKAQPARETKSARVRLKPR
jgi:molybdopterin synthase catalytic subunit